MEDCHTLLFIGLSGHTHDTNRSKCCILVMHRIDQAIFLHSTDSQCLNNDTS